MIVTFRYIYSDIQANIWTCTHFYSLLSYDTFLTVDHYFTINDLKELLNHPLHDANWRVLGEELGFENHELDTIQANNANFPKFSQCCMRNVLSDWLRFVRAASCNKLVNALAIAGMTEAAEEVCMQYGKPLAVVTNSDCN